MIVKVKNRRTGQMRSVDVERAIAWARTDLKKSWEILSELTSGGLFLKLWRPNSDAEKIQAMHHELANIMDCLKRRSPRSAKMKDWMCEEIAVADLLIRIMQFSYLHDLRVPEAIMARILNLTKHSKAKDGEDD